MATSHPNFANQRILHLAGMCCLTPFLLLSLAMKAESSTPVVTAATTNETAICGATSSGPGFLTTDSAVNFNFSYTGGNAGDQFTIYWLEPGGTEYAYSTFTQTTTGGSYCYVSSLDIAGSGPAAITGNWSVQLVWKTTTLATVPFTITTPSVVTSSATTNLTPVCSPGYTQNEYLVTDPVVYFNFSYTGGTAGDQYTFSWIEPNGSVYQTGTYTQATTGGNYCYYVSINIAGFSPAALPGTWTAKLSWNGTQLASVPFTINPANYLVVRSTSVNVVATQTCVSGSPCGPLSAWTVAPTSIPIVPGTFTFTSATFDSSGNAVPNWLVLTESEGVLSIGVNQAAVTPGAGFISISSDGAPNSPQTIEVDAGVSCSGTGCPKVGRGARYAAADLGPSVYPPVLSFSAKGVLSQSVAITAPSGNGTVTSTLAQINYNGNSNNAQNWLSVANCPASGNCQLTVNPAGLILGQEYVATVVFSSVAGTCTNGCYARTFPVTVTLTVPAPSPLQFLTSTPCRIIDTRRPAGPLGGPFLAGGTTRTVPIPSSTCGVPATAQAYSLNFTAVPRTGQLGYLTVWPTGQTQPLVSTLNSPAGSTIANAAIVPAGTAGAINAFASNDTDLIIDINGYFVPPASGTLQFYPLPPCRVLDTRSANGVLGGPAIPRGNSRSFPIPSSSCGAPSTAAAFSLNSIAVPAGPLDYLTVWPAGQSQPTVSTLNSPSGAVIANATVVPAGIGGDVNFFATNTTNLAVDINGYFASPGTGGLNFYPVIPCRVVDTRNPVGALGGPTMVGTTTRNFPFLQGSCGIPSGIQAYSLNVTVVPQGSFSYLSVWPSGESQPTVSTLNSPLGNVIANAAIVPAGPDGSIDVYVTQTTDVVIDINGYFAP